MMNLLLVGSLLVTHALHQPKSFDPPKHVNNLPDRPSLPLGGARIVAIGGGLTDDNKAIFNRLLPTPQESMLQPAGPYAICIVPFASGAQDEAATRMTERFEKNLAKAKIGTLPDPTRGDQDFGAAHVMLSKSNVIFFTGGDQSRIMTRFSGEYEPLLASMAFARRRHNAVVGGTSAGAAVLSNPMFTGGGSESALAGTAPDDGEKEAGKPVGEPKGTTTERARGVQLGRGLGLVEPIIDTHFFPRGRVGRLVAAVDQRYPTFGLGIDEDRAVEFVHPSRFRAIGPCAALFVDVRQVRHEGKSRSFVRVSLLSDGDEWSLRSPTRDWLDPRWIGEPSPDNLQYTTPRKLTANAVALTPPPAPEKTPDAWGKNVFLNMLKRLAADPTQPQRAQSEKFSLVLRADERTKFGWSADQPEQLTIIDARLDIFEREAVEGK